MTENSITVTSFTTARHSFNNTCKGKFNTLGPVWEGGWANTFDDVIRPREKQTPPTRRPVHITCEGTAESHCWILKLTELGHVQKWLLQPRPRSVGLQTTVVKWKYMAGLWWPRSENSGQSNVIPTVPIHHGERRREGVTVAYVSHWTLCSRKRMDQHHCTLHPLLSKPISLGATPVLSSHTRIICQFISSVSSFTKVTRGLDLLGTIPNFHPLSPRF